MQPHVLFSLHLLLLLGYPRLKPELSREAFHAAIASNPRCSFREGTYGSSCPRLCLLFGRELEWKMVPSLC